MIEDLKNKEEFLLELPGKFKNILGKRMVNHPEQLELILSDIDHIKNEYSTLFKKREAKTNKRK